MLASGLIMFRGCGAVGAHTLSAHILKLALETAF